MIALYMWNSVMKIYLPFVLVVRSQGILSRNVEERKRRTAAAAWQPKEVVNDTQSGDNVDGLIEDLDVGKTDGTTEKYPESLQEDRSGNSGPDMLERILVAAKDSEVIPTTDHMDNEISHLNSSSGALIADDPATEMTEGEPSSFLKGGTLQETDLKALALENAVKIQRLESFFKEIPQGNAAKRGRGRPPGSGRGGRTLHTPATDSIKNRLRKSIDLGHKNLRFRVAIIHGANDAVLRRKLWAGLLNFTDGNTVFIGDFNAVKGAHERISGVLPSRSSCEDFCKFIDDMGFLEPSTSGLQFSWSGRRFFPNHVETLLDRALVSSSFDILWDSVNTHVLPRLTSDHSAIVLQCKPHLAPGKRPFRFQHMWVEHPGFSDLVRASWGVASNIPCPIYNVMIKLKRLKSALREWNKTTFGCLDAKLAEAQEELASVQARISRDGYTDASFDEEVTKQAVINTMLTRKNVQLQQQSRIKWLQDGDRNTTFFHKALRQRKSGLVISHLNIAGAVVYEQSVIERHIVEHFTTLFSQWAASSVDLVDIEANIDLQVNEDHNRGLIEIPYDEEITAAVHDMEASSAPGPDGFSGVFFHRCWDIVKEDTIRVVRCFFLSSYLPNGCNANTLVLIPKVEAVASVLDLRLIILSNFFFKIISKVMAVRLNRVASDIVSQNQFGFISGRSIHDCIILGSEGFNCMNRTNCSANMACKIDIKKAFDTMSWDFILKVFRVLGFHERFIQWLSIIFSSARISILYNGHLSGYFACTRGVRQGDPLSPIIFGIAEDLLSHLILNCVAARRLTPMSFSRTMLFPTHLLYADDILIFCRAFIRNAKTIKHILEYYGELSGWPKSLLHEIDRKCRNFIWTGNTEQKPSCSVKWSRCCTIKEEGGLGIRSFTLMNKSYLMKLAWNMIKGNSFAHKVLRSRYLTPHGYAKANVANSSVWIGVKHEINDLVDNSYAVVGNGMFTLFWLDDWLGYKISDKLGIPSFLWGFMQQSISDYFFDGCWHFSANFVESFPDIVCDILLIPLGNAPDERFWKPSLRGDVTSSLAFANISNRYPKVVWGKWIWDPAVPIRRSLIC
ncbi:uncharacterized protein LOC131008538 [Salvia miltiorrhiza]|uniref:uncharacterized protein LOC131008538 n=1 Tax=Salvia miltiorrhiza TaxID=226208 RepID=UPI0025ABEC0A|nr:uncharacterized protein LOC131008538 [Salvia miltiorrhiza]